MTSQITGNPAVCSTNCSYWHLREHLSSASIIPCDTKLYCIISNFIKSVQIHSVGEELFVKYLLFFAKDSVRSKLLNTLSRRSRMYVYWSGSSAGGLFNSLRPRNAYMCQWTGPSLVQTMACCVPSHYLNQCWHIVNWTIRNKIQWNIDRNSIIQEMGSKISPENGDHFVSFKNVETISTLQKISG